MSNTTRWFRNREAGALVEMRFQEPGHPKRNPDALDEIVSLDEGTRFHLEEMDDNFWWFNFNGISVWLRANGPISISWEPEDMDEIDKPDEARKFDHPLNTDRRPEKMA